MISKLPKNRIFIGWNEWCELGDLHLPAIKAKIDTGAKTSALHAFDISPLTRRGIEYVKFSVYPLQNNEDIIVNCIAKVVDHRRVMSSNGHQEQRYVISTNLTLGERTWPIQLTLSNRDPLRFRMLLGREALKKQTVIVPKYQLMQGERDPVQLKSLYGEGEVD